MRTIKIHRNAGITFVEILIVVGVLLLLAVIAVPKYTAAKKESQRLAALYESVGYVPTFRIKVESGSLVDLANRFGTEGVAEDPVRYGGAFLKRHKVVGDTASTNSEISLYPYEAAIFLLHQESGAKVYRHATLRELLSFGLSDQLGIPRDRYIVALDSFRLDIEERGAHRLYPVIKGRDLDFVSERAWSTNFLIAVVRVK